MEGIKEIATFLLVIVSVTFVATEQCLKDGDIHACENLSFGNYATCAPECEKGKFIACTGSGPVNMQCPDNAVYYKEGQPFTAPLVFDATKNSCEYKYASCPRPDVDPYAPGR